MTQSPDVAYLCYCESNGTELANTMRGNHLSLASPLRPTFPLPFLFSVSFFSLSRITFAHYNCTTNCVVRTPALLWLEFVVSTPRARAKALSLSSPHPSFAMSRPFLTASFANPRRPLSSSSLADSLESLSLSIHLSLSDFSTLPLVLYNHLSPSRIHIVPRTSFFLLVQQRRHDSLRLTLRLLFLSRKLHRYLALPSLEELLPSLFLFLSLKFLPSFSFKCLAERETWKCLASLCLSLSLALSCLLAYSRFSCVATPLLLTIVDLL